MTIWIEVGFFELASTNKIFVNSLFLHEVKNETLLDYAGDFELIGSMLIGDIKQKAKNRFKNIDVLSTYNNSIEKGSNDSDDAIFKGWLFKLNTSEFIKVNRSQDGSGTDFKQDIVENIGKYCYIPTSGNCFITCLICLSGKDYTEEFSTFIRAEHKRSNVITSARIHQFC